MHDHAARARSGEPDARADELQGESGTSGEPARCDPAVGLALSLDGTATWTID